MCRPFLRIALLFLFVSLLLQAGHGAASAQEEAPASDVPADPAAIDLLAYTALEVTQGVQTYKASGNVPLVAGKRTYVFFYARVASGGTTAVTTAELKAERNGQTVTLKPLNAGGVVELNGFLPDRYAGTRQFRFELPNGFREGTVKLTATLNPGNKSPVEPNTGNNTGAKTVTFENVPTLTMYVFDVRYKVFGEGNRVFTVNDFAPTGHREMFIQWLKRAYPVNSIAWYKHSVYIGKWVVHKGDLWVTCITPNIAMALWYASDGRPSFSKAYGMVADSGGYMRGCAEIAGKKVASGPTGPGSRGWDFDGSYGDWYGGHELAHLFNRHHTNSCGEPIPRDPFPYPSSSISPRNDAYVNAAQEWGTAVAGVKIDGSMVNPEIYNGSWRDIASYCSKRWLSDFTYKKFLDQFASLTAAQTPPAPRAPMDRLVVAGAIDDASGAVMVAPVYLVPNAEEAPEHQPGDYAIVLRNGNGGELLRYAFTPSEPGNSDAASQREAQEGFDPADPAAQMTAPRTFIEFVPNMAGVDRIDIEGPGGLLHTVSAGSGPPVVTVQSPVGGIRIPPNQTELDVEWSASDPDGDPLYFRVEYSPDGGDHWELYAIGITETLISIPAENLKAGSKAWVRVSASDGIHTTMATPAETFTVLNHPPTVEILPVGDLGDGLLLAADTATTTIPVFAVGQTISFQAAAYDVELGALNEEVAWSSSIDGPLGTGALLSIATLSTGVHTVTVTAGDGQGGNASASTVVRIVAELADLPPVPDGLLASPGSVYLASREAMTQTTLYLGNLKAGSVIQWNAAVNKSWILLSAASGETPDELTISLAPGQSLPDGLHEAVLTLTSPQIPGAKLELPIVTDVLFTPLYLPAINR